MQLLLQPRASLPEGHIMIPSIQKNINDRSVWFFCNEIGAVTQYPYNRALIWGVGSAFHPMKIHILWPKYSGPPIPPEQVYWPPPPPSPTKLFNQALDHFFCWTWPFLDNKFSSIFCDPPPPLPSPLKGEKLFVIAFRRYIISHGVQTLSNGPETRGLTE